MVAATPSLAPTLDAVRLFLHVAAATVWVGGQIVMLGLVPAARNLGDGAPRVLANAFARLAWPAFVLLVVTGFWNISAVGKGGTAWEAVLGVKLAVVALSGLAAWLHGRATSRSQLALWGSVSGSASIVALFLGILLAG